MDQYKIHCGCRNKPVREPMNPSTSTSSETITQTENEVVLLDLAVADLLVERVVVVNVEINHEASLAQLLPHGGRICVKLRRVRPRAWDGMGHTQGDMM